MFIIFVVNANNSHLEKLKMRKFKIVASGVMIAVLLSFAVFCTVFFSRMGKDGKVVVTIFPLYDICREILGTDDDIVMLQDNGSDMHSYQATASDIATISKAELFIVVGGESDEWVGGAIRSAGNNNLKTLSMMDVVNTLEESDDNISEGGHDHDDHDHDEDEAELDEHIWLSIKNMIIATTEIKNELLTVFPERAEIINENASNYIEKLNALDMEYSDALVGKNAFYLIADRFPFIYLMSDYGLSYHAAFSGCSTESEASVPTMTELISKVDEKKLKYIYITESSDGSIANRVKMACDHPSQVEILTLNSCQSVSRNDLEKISYLSIMKDNLEKFKLGVNL